MDVKVFYLDEDEKGDYGFTTGNSATSVTGNAKLVQKFMITLFDKGFRFDTPDGEYIESYGGSFTEVIKNYNLNNDVNSLNAAIVLAINNTVESIRLEQDSASKIRATERLKSANLNAINIDGDIVGISIKVIPEEEDGANLILDVPMV